MRHRVVLGITLLLVLGLSALPNPAGAAPVVDIVLEGLDAVQPQRVQEAVTATKISQPLDMETVFADLQAILDLGYFAEVGYALEEHPDGVTVILKLKENPRLEEIRFVGTAAQLAYPFRSELRTQVGDVLNARILVADMDALEAWAFQEQGRGVRVTDIDLSAGVLVLTVEQLVIEAIAITGHTKTEEAIIRRELTLAPGEPLDRRELERSLENLFRLDYFETIDIDTRRGETVDGVELVIAVEEQPTGLFGGGLGYNTEEGLLVYAELRDRNFRGRGQTIGAQIDVSGVRRDIHLEWAEPVLAETELSLSLAAFRQDVEVPADAVLDAGRRVSLGGQVRLAYPLAETIHAHSSLRVQSNRYSGSPAFEAAYADYSSRILSLGLTSDTRVDPFPLQGYRLAGEVAAALPVLGGEASFLRARMDAAFFHELWSGGVVVAGRFAGGRLLSGDLPENEQFHLFSEHLLRGPQTEGLRGDSFAGFSAELRLPLAERLSGVLFADLASAFPTASWELADLHLALGAGVRVDSPLGMLRLDYGWGQTAAGDWEGRVFFGIGQTF